MEFQGRQGRTTEVRGCLLKNFLDMRKRSLIRSESQDSGFSVDSYYEPLLSSSFDAEKCLEELGFAADSTPLIPDRFIPSLIHRISKMPDETMVKLDTRVWTSIDSFKKKEHTLWFFTKSSVVCDLCVGDLQRSYSSPGMFFQESCDSWHPSNNMHLMKRNNSAAVRVQNWLARSSANSISLERTSDNSIKANIARIGNQSSTESGILSTISDDDAYTAASYIESDSVTDSYNPLDLVDGSPGLDFSKPSSVMMIEKYRLSESRTPDGVRNTRMRNSNAVLSTEATSSRQRKISPSQTLSVFSPSIMSNGRRNHYKFSNDKSSSDEQVNSSRFVNGDDKDVDDHVSRIVDSSEVITYEEGISDHVESTVKQVPTDAQDLNSETAEIRSCLDAEQSNGHCDETELGDGIKDSDTISLLASLSNNCDLSGFDSKKKRHSFDAACSRSAADKRKRFRSSHSRTHNFLFQTPEDSCGAQSVTATDDVTPSDSSLLRDLQEEPQGRDSTELITRDPQDISDHSGSDADSPFELPNGESCRENFESCSVFTRSDSESSDQYFSCDELLTGKTEISKSHCTAHGDIKERKTPNNHDDLALNLTGEQSVKIIFSKDKDYYRSTYAPSKIFPSKYKLEYCILNKILKRDLKLSVLSPTEEMSRYFFLGSGANDAESFSQILNSNNTSNSLESKVIEHHVRSLTYGAKAPHDVKLNPDMTVKSINKRMSDKTEALDNNTSCITKPFVRNLSITSDMVALKCEVQLINYDGLALFWYARNLPQNRSDFTDSMSTSNRRFANGIRMAVNSEDGVHNTNNRIYFNEVRLEINGEEEAGDSEKKGSENSVDIEEFLSGKGVEREEKQGILKSTKAAANTENPCGRALKDLEDLRSAIQKAKETRMSASRELKLLQELLQGGDSEEDQTPFQRTTAAVHDSTPRLPAVEITNQDKRIKALSELQQKSENVTSQNQEFWEEEIRKAKEETSQGCHEKFSIMEEKLRTTEEKLARALKENGRLKYQMELRSAAFPVCKCNAEAQPSDFSYMNGISHEDHIISVHKPSVPTKNFWQEWDRLQSDLIKAERKADELNILLNQKLIELNKMQLTISKQTKEMVLLEKAYFQLRSHLSKRRFNKSTLSPQLSSTATKASPTTERASETSSKASDPEIPP